MLGSANVSMAQPSAPRGETRVPQFPVIKGLAKGYEKVVAVTEDRPPFANEIPGSLLRELPRQAFLIAAEEELGLVTLDDAIGELIPAGDAAAGPFTIKVSAVRKKPVRGERQIEPVPIEYTITITRPEFQGQAFTWTAPPVSFSEATWYEPLAEQMEVMSRGAFVEALRKAGFEKSGAIGKVLANPNLEHRMDFVSQFATIRYLHSQMRAGQENVAVLEGLVRSYADLGSLTDFHWSPASKVFKARSLLYAQRLIAKHGPTPSALAHRAYALALTGRHAAALRSIEAAGQAQGKESPDWLTLIEAYCSFQIDVLERGRGVEQERAQYLRMSMADLRFEQSQSLLIIQKFLKINPACCRAADMLASMTSLGIQRGATETTFQESWSSVYERVAAIPDLPAAAKKLTDSVKGRRLDVRTENGKRKELITLLLFPSVIKNNAGPSWPVLADMIRDASFAQAWRTLSTEVNVLGVRSETTLQRFKPLVQGHPLDRQLDCFSRDGRRAQEAFEQFNSIEHLRNLEVSAVPLGLQYFMSMGHGEGDQVVSCIGFNTDEIYEDGVRRLALPYYGPDPPDLAAISPHWPQSIAESVKLNPAISLTEVEKKHGRSIVVLQALHRQYLERDQLDDAIRCLSKLIEIAPACESCLELATLYEGAGNRDKWQQTLEKGLTTPNLGLEHADVHFRLAVGLMRQGKGALAKSHVAKAAESNAAFGLWLASRYAEANENWTEAEKYQQQASKRYDEAATDWYFWCVRTGRGKLKDAKNLAINHWSRQAGTLSPLQQWQGVVGHMIDGNDANALPFLSDLFRQDVKAGLYAALLADTRNNAAQRDEWFQKIASKWSTGSPFVELTNQFQGVISGKETGRWNPEVFEALAVLVPEGDVPWFYLFAGLFLQNHNEKNLAQDYLRVAATSFQTNNLGTVLAADALRKQKTPVGKARVNLLPDTLTTQSELLSKASWAQKYHKYGDAEEALTLLLKSHPNFLPALLARAAAYESQEKYQEAITDLEAVLKVAPNFDRGYIRLARLLAACRQDEIRNGAKALEYAERAASLRQFESALLLSTLAWAHAECGQFDKAIALEERARKLPGVDTGVNARLLLFRTSRPYRMTEMSTASVVESQPTPEPIPTIPPAQSSQIGEWIDLLEWTSGVKWGPIGINWDEQISGTPTKQGIAFDALPFRRYPLAAVVDGNYELEVEFKRLEGREPVAVYFPVGIHTMRLLLDADSSHVSFVAGKEFGRRQHSPISNGEPHRILVQVRHDAGRASFQIDLDGVRDFIKWEGDPVVLRNQDTSDWSTNMIRRPWIGSSNNKLVFQRMRIRMQSGMIRRDPITDADRDQDRRNGIVRLTGEKAINPAVGAWSFCINQIPLELRGIGAECRWPMIKPGFRVCDDYFGAHAPSRLALPIPPGAKSFSAVAFNDSSRIAKYSVMIDGKQVYASAETAIDIIKVDIPANAKLMELIADPLGDSAYDHTYWCYPRFHDEIADRVTDSMLDDKRAGPKLTVTSGSAEGLVTRSKPTGKLKSGPISFRDFLPCEEFFFAHAKSTVTFEVPEGMTRFSAIGYNVIDHSAQFEVWADSRRIYESPVVGIISINVKLPPNTKLIHLRTTEAGGGTGDQCIWCFPRLSRN